jgi:hypothetical protein
VNILEKHLDSSMSRRCGSVKETSRKKLWPAPLTHGAGCVPRAAQALSFKQKLLEDLSEALVWLFIQLEVIPRQVLLSGTEQFVKRFYFGANNAVKDATEKRARTHVLDRGVQFANLAGLASKLLFYEMSL